MKIEQNVAESGVVNRVLMLLEETAEIEQNDEIELFARLDRLKAFGGSFAEIGFSEKLSFSS